MFVVVLILILCFFFKQKTAYEMRISDWSSDVCSSDLQDEKIDLRMIIRDRLGNVLKKDGFTRTGRRNDQRALALALRRNNINDARRLVLHRGNKGIEA